MSKELTDALDGIMKPDLDGVEEKPTETPVTPEVKEPATDDDPHKGILDSYNAKDGEGLDAFLERQYSEAKTFKKKYGDSQNVVGDLRKELSDIKDMLKRDRPANDYSDDFVVHDSNGEKAATMAEIKSWYGQIREQEGNAQRKAQEWYDHQMAEIKDRPTWQHLEATFDKVCQNKRVIEAVQSGRKTLTDVYRDVEFKVMLDQANKNNSSGSRVEGKTDEPDSSGRTVRNETDAEVLKKRRAKATENCDVEAAIDNLNLF